MARTTPLLPVVAVLALVVALGCGEGRRSPLDGLLAERGLRPIPKPSLEESEPAVRRQIEARQVSMDELAEDADLSSQRLAEALGRLGMLYHAYNLHDAAEPCYLNARDLEPAEADWIYLLGVLAQAAGDPERGRELLEQTLELRPGDRPSLLRLGELHLDLGQPQRAREFFERALELRRASWPALYGVGRAAARMGDHQAAIAAFSQALEVEPRADRIHHGLGMSYRALGDDERARFHLERQGSLEVRFQDPLVFQVEELSQGTAPHLVRAGRAAGEGRYQVAAEEYRQALEIDPGSLEARMGLASVRARTGELTTAARLYEAVLADHPQEVSALQQLGRVRERQGSLAEAETRFRAALALQPGVESIRRDLARILRLQERWSEAVAQYESLVEAGAADDALRHEYALALEGSGSPRRAIDQLRLAVATEPRNAALRLSLARLLGRVGQLEEARELCRGILENGDASAPDRARAAHNLAVTLIQEGQQEGAEEMLRRAIQLDGSLREAHLALGGFLAARGDNLEAAESFGQALKLDAGDARARLAEAQALIAGGAHREARSRLEEGLRLQPDNGFLAHLLARLLATSPDASVRDGARALETASGVFASSRRLDHGETLAMALAETGDFDAAAELQAALIQQAERAGGVPLEEMRENLIRYRRQEPVRQR